MATGGTSKGKRARRATKREESRPPRHHGAIHAGLHPADGVPQTPRLPEAGRVRRRAAAAAIGALERRVTREWPDAGRLLADLGRAVDGARHGKHGRAGRKPGAAGERLAAAITRCLDEAALTMPGAGRWALDEGAAWGLSRLARALPGDARVGGSLERLLAEADAADATLRQGDTRGAAFVLVLDGIFAPPATSAAAARAAALWVADIDRWTTPAGGPAAGASAPFVHRVLGWAATRTAALAAGAELDEGEAAARRFRGALLAALRLLGDGGALPGHGGPEAVDTAPLVEALRADPLARPQGASRGALERTLAAVTARRRGRGAEPRRGLGRDALDGSVATLRTGWGAGSVRVLFDFSPPAHRLEIAAGDRLVVDGAWEFQASADGAAVEPESAWTVSCHESDDDATFLEVTAPLPGGLQAERVIVLLPQARVVLLADAITDGGALLPAVRRPQHVLLRSRLTTAGGGAVPEDETRELLLQAGRRHWRVLPLALPEWRCAPSPGSLECAGDVLEQRVEAHGGRVVAPLWIDADPRRARRPLTWRQLTVADSRSNLGRHEAVGFRVQVGQEQWLLYRALDTPRNRTVLGCNVACEFLVGRIKASGEVARTLEIE